jgi:ATP-binding cassette, subfamily B, bacterial PglK
MKKIILNSLKILNKKYKFFFYLIVSLSLIGSMLEMLSIFILFQLVRFFVDPVNFHLNFLNIDKNYISNYTDGVFLIKIVCILMIIYSLKFFYFLFMYKKQFSFTNNLTAFLSTNLLKKYLEKDYVFHNNTNSSILIRNINTEVTQFTVGVMQQLLTLITELFIIIGIVSILLIYEPYVTIISLFFLGIVAGIYLFLTKKIFVKYGELRQNLWGIAIKKVLEALHGIKDIKIYSAENYFIRSYNDVIKKFATINTKVMIFQQVPRLTLELAIIFGMLIFVYLNSSSFLENKMILQTLGLFAISSFKLMPSITKILVASQNFKFNKPSIKILTDEMQAHEPKIDKKIEENKKLDVINSIKLKNICYQYSKSNKLILNNINIEVKKGDCIGIVGESGSGKSTLLNIFMGLLQPSSGEVLVNDKNINNFKKEWLSKIGYVPQKIYLIDDSIKSNIAFGEENLDIIDDKLIKASKVANIYNFWKSLPNGIDTEIGETGNRISGGQAQRIGIARAFYNICDIIILDEATSALDIKNENEIMKIIKSASKDTTFIFVSHKESILRDCNAIYRIENGKLLKK